MILNKPIPAPTVHKNDFDPELEKIILKALDKDPDYRYQNSLDMVFDLEKYIRANSLPSSHLELAEYVKSLFRVSHIPQIENLKEKVERDEIELDFDEDFLNDWSDEGALGAELPEETLDMDDEEYFAIMADPEKAEKFFNTPEPIENNNDIEEKEDEEKEDIEEKEIESEIKKQDNTDKFTDPDKNDRKTSSKTKKITSEDKEKDSENQIKKTKQNKNSNNPKKESLEKNKNSSLSSVVIIIILVTISLLFFFYTQS